jgi:hypothetical protein
MKKSHTKSGASHKGQSTDVEIIELLRRVENHLARGRKLGWVIFKKLESIDDSISLFAAQKKRELTPERPDGATAP